MKFNIIKEAIIHRKITIFIALLFLLLGSYSYIVTPKQENPDIQPPIMFITTIYPGASSQVIESFVSEKLEAEIMSLEKLETMQSYSKDNVSLIYARFKHGSDIEKLERELRVNIDNIKGSLPDGISSIEIRTDVSKTAGIILSLSGNGEENSRLTKIAQDVINELNHVDGIGQFEINGSFNRQVIVEVDYNILNSIGLSMQDIINIIKANNISIPSGKIMDEGIKVNLKTQGNFSSIEDIGNLVVFMGETGPLMLSDIANIKEDYNTESYTVEHNGSEAVLITGYFEENKNIVFVGNKIEKEIDNIKDQIPKEVELEYVVFQPNDVVDAISNFEKSLIMGIVLVIFVVFIGMGLKNALVVSTAIPLSILISISTFRLIGVKIDQMSITALIVALGMLVDNAIVVSDSIQNKFDEGLAKINACLSGTKEVAIPVFTSTLTTVGAFIPLLMLNSIAGEYISAIPKILIISLFSSYLVAVLFIPVMASIFFKENKKVKARKKVKKYYKKLLAFNIKRKYISYILLFFVILATAYFAMGIDMEFFPEVDKDLAYIDITLEGSYDMDKTSQKAIEVVELLDSVNQVESVTTVTGGGLPKFYDSMKLYLDSPNFAQILINLDFSKEGQFEDIDEFYLWLKKETDSIEDASIKVNRLVYAEPIEAPIIVKIVSDDKDKLINDISDIQGEISKIPGVINLQNDFEGFSSEFNMGFEGVNLSFYGLTKYDVLNEISIAVLGRNASSLSENGNEKDIIVKTNIETIEDLNAFSIANIDDNKIVLGNISQIEKMKTLPIVSRYNSQYSIMLYNEIGDNYSLMGIENDIEEVLLDYGYDFEFDGERQKINSNFGNVLNSAVLAVVLIFLILLFQFKSFIQSIIILITVPLSAVGSVFGLLILDIPLSFTALFGIVSLIGIVVNNAIVLIDYINKKRQTIENINIACIDAASIRLRPIMLSTTTTIIGLLPLMLSNNSLFTPMSVALAFGLMISTSLTLIVIPVTYSLLQRKSY